MPAQQLSASVMELLDWISQRTRSYDETLAAWKTHCPRLSAWEDALAAGLVAVERNGHGELVALTAAGATVNRRPRG